MRRRLSRPSKRKPKMPPMTVDGHHLNGQEAAVYNALKKSGAKFAQPLIGGSGDFYRLNADGTRIPLYLVDGELVTELPKPEVVYEDEDVKISVFRKGQR